MNYLFWAYTAIWTLLCVYTLYLGKKQSNLFKELELVRAALKDKK